MPSINWADIQRQNNQKSIQSVKAIQEINSNYLDRENKVNGYAGSASDILVRFSPTGNYATFGSGNNARVGP